MYTYFASFAILAIAPSMGGSAKPTSECRPFANEALPLGTLAKLSRDEILELAAQKATQGGEQLEIAGSGSYRGVRAALQSLGQSGYVPSRLLLTRDGATLRFELVVQKCT